MIIVATRGDNPLCDFGNILKDAGREANDLNLCGFSHVLCEEYPCTCFG